MRSYLASSAMGVVVAIVVGGTGGSIWQVAAAGAAAAAIVHAARALAPDSLAALAGAVLAALLAGVSMVEHHAPARSWLALAAAAWAIGELARVSRFAGGPARTPRTVALTTLVPATIAAVLAPGCVALVAVAGARLVGMRRTVGDHGNDSIPRPIDPAPLPGVLRAPAEPRGRSARAGSRAHAARRTPTRERDLRILIPIAGCGLCVLAVVAASAREGAFATLASWWYATPHADVPAPVALGALADGLGPLAAVAALAGTVVLARTFSAHAFASLAIAGCVAGAILVDLRAGAPDPLSFGLAALCAGVAVGRFAGTIRIASGQAALAATCGLMLLVPPAWSIIG